eukprot:2508463-Rhodomonas_salina.1
MPKMLTPTMRANNIERTSMKQVAAKLRHVRAADICTVTCVKAQCELLPGKHVIIDLLDFYFEHDLIWIKVLWESGANQVVHNKKAPTSFTWEPLDALAFQQQQLVSRFLAQYLVCYGEKTTIGKTKMTANGPKSPLSVRIASPRGSASASPQ